MRAGSPLRFIPSLRQTAWLALLALPALATAAGVSVKFDLSTPNGSPFPSDRFTQPDWSQKTYRRVNLPKPDCAVFPSDCADIDVINTLDGFNTQPRITVPFSGPIDPATVNSDTVYLVNLGDTQTSRGFGQKVGINQVAWDVASNTLVFESDELLAEHSRYLLVVTTGVRDAAGHPIEAGRFGHFHRGGKNSQHPDREDDGDVKDYGKSLRDGMYSSRAPQPRVAALSVFTTQTTTADLLKIHRQIKRSRPAPVNFNIANGGTARAVFPLSGLQGIQFRRQDRHGGHGHVEWLHRFISPDAGAQRGARLGRQPRLWQVHFARLPDGRQGHPRHAHRLGPAAPGVQQRTGFRTVRAERRQAGRWVAGGDLRPRLHRQHVRSTLDGGLGARIPGHCHDGHQRGGPWRWCAGHAQCAAHQWIAGGGAGRRARHRPGRQHRDRLDRGCERRGAGHHRRQPRRLAPDGGRSDATGAADRSGRGRGRRWTRRPRQGPHLLLRPVVRRNLRHHPAGGRRQHQGGCAQCAGRLHHRDRPAWERSAA